MRMGQGVRTGLGHGGITCVLQTQFSSFFFFERKCDAFCDFGTCCGTTSSSENVILIDVSN